MITRTQFAVEETYHCYTRGIDGRVTFKEDLDYRRFQELLYLCNNQSPVHRSNLPKGANSNVYSLKRDGPIVSILAYTLMPNHFHLLLREQSENGISTFMLKLGTAYCMYFNKKYDRIGSLFVKPFRSRHVHDDRYLQHVVNYIHCNPAELFEKNWKSGVVADLDVLQKRLSEYSYSSLADHLGSKRSENSILDTALIHKLFKRREFQTTLEEARQYYSAALPPFIKGSP